MRRCAHWVAWCAVSAVATPVLAQSLPIEEQPEQPPLPAPAPTPAPKPAPAPPLTLPTPVSTPVVYPEGAAGEANVTLELTLSPQGTVTRVIALEGDPPFTNSAVKAAEGWTFRPALRGEQAVAAKIRYRVHFVPPVDETEPEPKPDAAPATSPAQAAPTSKPKPGEPAGYEIIVQGTRPPIHHELGRAEIHDMPGAFGDPYRAIEVLPGVVPIVSGLPYFYVRGAPPGNVGYFFDGIPVPFLYHFAAGPGVLHPAFVDRVDLYPGAYPARYGRFAGAIVAGEMAPPGHEFRGEASVRIIDSGGMVEAPFARGRGAIQIGGRYSYTALVLSLIVPEVTVSYWDYQQRTRYQLNADDSIELVAFGSGDYVSETEKHYVSSGSSGSTGYRAVERENTLVDVGFHRIDLRLDHRLSGGNWRNALMLGRDRTGLDNSSVSLTNYMVGGRSELEQRLEKKLTFRAGADVLLESLSQKLDQDDQFSDSQGDVAPPQGAPPETLPEPDPNQDENDPDFGLDRSRRDFTAGAWADFVWDLTPNVRVTPGLRLDLFVSGKRAALGADPRISVEYKLSDKLSIVHGLGLVHQAPSFVVPVPGLKPSLEGGLQRAVQYSAGFSYTLPAGFSGSFALFQSAFFNMTDLISLVQLENTTNDEVVDFRTTGQAYGAELMIRRSLTRRLGGLLSYTLSRSQRFARRLRGPAATDRTHVLNLAASYDLGREWRLGSRLLFYSGIPARVAYLEAAQRPPRTPPFWRLDFKLQKRWYIRRPDRWWGLVFEVLNTTLNKEQLDGSCNAFSCDYQEIGPVTIPSIGAEGAF